MEFKIKKVDSPANTPKIKILFEGWVNIPHSYAIVFCFQLIHLYKNYNDKIEFYVKEMPYYNPMWNNSKKLVYCEEYNSILTNFKKYNGEVVDLIYRQTYPYNLCIDNNNHHISKCIFYTSEFATLDKSYFILNKEHYDFNEFYIKSYLENNKNIFFTSPSLWSSKGMSKYITVSKDTTCPNRNKIITHGVDPTVFYKDTNKITRSEIREKYNVKNDEILLINIGAMTKNKGIMLILETLHILVNKLNKKEFKLMLKGSDDLYQCTEFLKIYFNEFQNSQKMTTLDINNLLDNHIIFTNKTLSFKRINDLYNAADLYISPYLAEGFNLTTLEALSSGLQVLVPRTGSTEEYMNDIHCNGGSDFIHYVNSTVVVLDAADGTTEIDKKMVNNIKIEDLVNALLDFLKNTNTNEIARKNNYDKMFNHIKQNYSWDVVSGLLYKYFLEIISS